MNVDSKNTRPNEALTAEDHSKAMNFIGQNLLTSLNQSVEKLSPQLRNPNVVFQALSAFMANVIYTQSRENKIPSQQILDKVTRLVQAQLDSVSQASA